MSPNLRQRLPADSGAGSGTPSLPQGRTALPPSRRSSRRPTAPRPPPHDQAVRHQLRRARHHQVRAQGRLPVGPGALPAGSLHQAGDRGAEGEGEGGGGGGGGGIGRQEEAVGGRAVLHQAVGPVQAEAVSAAAGDAEQGYKEPRGGGVGRRGRGGGAGPPAPRRRPRGDGRREVRRRASVVGHGGPVLGQEEERQAKQSDGSHNGEINAVQTG